MAALGRVFELSSLLKLNYFNLLKLQSSALEEMLRKVGYFCFSHYIVHFTSYIFINPFRKFLCLSTITLEHYIKSKHGLKENNMFSC